MVDPVAISRAAEHLRAALTHVEAAQAVVVPRMFGRGAATAEVRSAMGLAASSGADALQLLGDDAVFVDARAAITALQDAAAAIRDRGVPVRERGSAAVVDAVAGVRVHAATLELVANVHGAPVVPPWSAVHVPTVRAAVTSSLDGAAERLPTWLVDGAKPEEYVGSVQRGSIRAALDLRTPDEVAAEVRRLVEPVAGDVDEQVERLGAIALLPDSMHGSLDDSMRGSLRGMLDHAYDTSEDRAMGDPRYTLQRAWVNAVRGSGADAEQLARTLADGPRDVVTANKVGALLEHDAASLGVPEADRYHLSSTLLDARTDIAAARALGALATVRSGATRAALDAEVRAIVASADLSAEHLVRLRELDALPRSMRPLPPEGMLARGEELDPEAITQLHDELRWSVERKDLLADVEAGHRAVLQELSAFVARGDVPFTRRELLRLARLQELGTSKGMPRFQSDAWTFREKLNTMRGETRDLQGEMQRLRAGLERSRIEADPSITRTTQVAALRRALAAPNDQLDLATLQQLRSIEEVGGTKGLQLPSSLRTLADDLIEDAAAGRGVAPELATELDAMRTWLGTWNLEGAADLQRIAANTGNAELPPHVNEFVGDNWDSLVRDPDSLAPLTTLLVRRMGASDATSPGYRRTISMAEDLVRTREPATPGALRELYDETLATLERNIQRMDGTGDDTYGMHPDYAEIGRVAANMPLLSHVPKPRPDTLSW